MECKLLLQLSLKRQISMTVPRLPPTRSPSENSKLWKEAPLLSSRHWSILPLASKRSCKLSAFASVNQIWTGPKSEHSCCLTQITWLRCAETMTRTTCLLRRSKSYNHSSQEMISTTKQWRISQLRSLKWPNTSLLCMSTPAWDKERELNETEVTDIFQSSNSEFRQKLDRLKADSERIKVMDFTVKKT